MPKADPHFSRPGDGARDPGFLEGGKMHTFLMLRSLAFNTHDSAKLSVVGNLSPSDRD